MEKRLLSIDETASLLGVTPHRAYALCRDGILPNVRLGRQVKIDVHRLERFLQAGGQA